MIIFFFFYFYDEEADSTVQVTVENVENFDEQDLEFFFSDQIRKVWHKQQEEWYFSVIDVCQVLSESTNPKNHWNMLKTRIRDEGNETYTNCVRLKMRAADGKMRLTVMISVMTSHSHLNRVQKSGHCMKSRRKPCSVLNSAMRTGHLYISSTAAAAPPGSPCPAHRGC